MMLEVRAMFLVIRLELDTPEGPDEVWECYGMGMGMEAQAGDNASIATSRTLFVLRSRAVEDHAKSCNAGLDHHS